MSTSKLCRGYVWLALCLVGQLGLAGAESPPVPSVGEAPPGMVLIAAGSYTPLYTAGRDVPQVAVGAVYLDRYAVTNAQYLAFVQANPQWQGAQVPRLFADAAYLLHWHEERPVDAWLQRPVTHVSWFAAQAYCRRQRKRLPSVAEWEYAALAGDTTPDGRSDAAYMTRLLEWYTRPTPDMPPVVGSSGANYWGVYDLHGAVWEWTADFNTALVTGESRGDSDVERNLFCGAGIIGTTAQERVNYPAFMRYAYRSSLQGTYTLPNLGFRCAKEAP